MSGLTILLSQTSNGAVAPFSAKIPGGVTFASGFSKTNTFGSISCTVTGGTGPFTYLWNVTPDTFGAWSSGGTASSYAPVASNVYSGSLATGIYTVTVTDTGTSKVLTSNPQTFQWFNDNIQVNPYL